MKHDLLPDARDLIGWADRQDAQGELPRLIRDLILATTKPTEISFPAGEGIQQRGWDGRLAVGENARNAFIPDGLSVWEVSTEGNPGKKATKDFRKRTKTPGSVAPGDTTYVAVSLRSWPGRHEWAGRRRKKGIWKDVRAIDAYDLETWLERAPAVHLRLGATLSRLPGSAVALEEFWNDWRHETKVVLSRDIVIAGRQAPESSVRAWLGDRESPTLSLQADTVDEAIAFLAATIESLTPQDSARWFAQAVVVHQPDTWRELTRQDAPLLLIPTFRDNNIVGPAIRGGHRVFLPLGRSDPASRSTLELPRPRIEPLRKALQELGIAEDQASALARIGRGGLQPLRRAIGHLRAALAPRWTTEGRSGVLVPALLARAWDDGNPLDREVLELLTSRRYESLCAELLSWERTNDPPIRRTERIWQFVAHHDTWELLAPGLTDAQGKRFATICGNVLGAVDPRWDLSPDQRWMAPALTRTPQHSEELRRGLVESLARLAQDTRVTLEIRDQPLLVARGLYEKASKDWRVWASLSPYLPDLAEIAPEAFLEAVEMELGRNDAQLLGLFGQDTNPITSATPHTGLLWALERLGWSPRYLTRAALILARLARRDPGGRTLNRPAASLHGLFVPWYPQTAATPDERLGAIDRVIAEEPAVGQRLLLSLQPNRVSSSLLPNAVPRWHEWKPAGEITITRAEYSRMKKELANRLVNGAAGSAEHWKAIIPELDRLPRNARAAALEGLRRDANAFSEDDRRVLWEHLQEFVNTHRSFHAAVWALPAEEVTEVADLLRAYESGDPIERNRWLFASHPRLDGPQDWRECEKRVEEQRREALQEIMRSRGVTGVLVLARMVEAPGIVGRTLGTIDLNDQEEERILTTEFGEAKSTPVLFAQGFIGGRIEKGEAQWALSTLETHRADWTAEQIATFFLLRPGGLDAWDEVDKEHPDVQASYWQRVTPYGLGQNTDHIRAARQFLAFKNPIRAVEILGLYGTRDPSTPHELIAEALEAALASDEPDGLHRVQHEVIELLQVLGSSDEVAEDRSARLEWMLLPLLSGYERVPTVLERQLERDPALFVTLCTIVYRAEGEEAHELNESEQRRWSNARELLESWRGLPGRGEHGQIDEERLGAWVREARDRLRDANRLAVGDIQIGQLLATAPSEDNGDWPHHVICDLIDDAGSAELEQGFSTGVFNQRGTFAYDPAEGGKQERDLAARFRAHADRLQARWPRTAAAIRGLEVTYERHAIREDTRTELDEDR